MIPTIYEGQTIRVTAANDTGKPQTVYVVKRYGAEIESATLSKITQRRKALLADGIAEGDSRFTSATQEVVREALADVIQSVENAMGPDGKPCALTERADIIAHLASLPKGWFDEVVAAILQPVAVSVTLGKD